MTAVARPMRQTVRRRLIRQAQATGEREAADRIYKLLDRQHKALNRELRQANLRKRLAKAERDTGDVASALYKAGGWAQWIETLTSGIKKALVPIVTALAAVETQYWRTRGKSYTPPDDTLLIAAYEERTRHTIQAIGDDTRTRVLAMLAAWYATQETLPELIDRLGQFFTPERADIIARTESQFIMGQLALDAMMQFQIQQWAFDLAPDEGPYPCQECVDYAAANPHYLTDDFPPLHPGDRCGVVYLDEDGREI